MGTRGLWGYVIDREEKLTYNHFDSYPESLGQELLTFLRQHASESGINVLREKARALELVDEDNRPTPEQQERLKRWHDARVSTGSPEEWYSLLRNTQGDPVATFESGFMIEYADFALDSLFCEWAYVIDLDHERLECYRGFQTEPHSEGRFANRAGESEADTDETIGESYYPVRLIAVYALRELPDDATFQEALRDKEEA